MINREDPMPLYYQIKSHIKGKIEDGAWSVGTEVPSEMDLADQFEVSRSTIRKALDELEKEGYVKKSQGKGTVVSEPKITPLAALTSFSENMQAAGLHPSYDTKLIKKCSPPRQVADFFGVDPDNDGGALYIKRILKADDDPIAIQNAYLSTKTIEPHIELFNETYLDNHSMYNLLEKECSIDLWTAEEEIDASLSGGEEEALLEMDSRKPLLVIRRKTSGRDDKPIEFVKLIFRADKYHYKFKLSRQDYKNKLIEPE